MVGALIFLLGVVLLQGALCQFLRTDFPHTVEVVKGLCVTIPCSFEIRSEDESALNESCKVVWRSFLDYRVVFDSSETSETLGYMNGEFRNRSCTTTLNAVSTSNQSLFLTLDCGDELFAEYDERPVDIVVRDELIPTVHPTTLRLRDGGMGIVSCSAPVPCLSHPPDLMWNPKPGASEEELHGGKDKAFVKTSVLRVDASQLGPPTKVSCSAVYEKTDGGVYATRESSLVAAVQTSPQILPSSDCVTTPTEVRCTCESEATPRPAIRWFLLKRASPPEVLPSVSQRLSAAAERSAVAVNRSLQDVSSLLCVSVNSVGSARREFPIAGISTLTPENAVPPDILNSSFCSRTANAVRCFCEATGTPPLVISWLLGDDLTIDDATERSSNDTAPAIKSAVSSRFDSRPENPLGPVCFSFNVAGETRRELPVEDYRNKRKRVSPKILPSSGCTRNSSMVRCTCETEGNPEPTVRWYLNRERVHASGHQTVDTLHPRDFVTRSVFTFEWPSRQLLSTFCLSFNSEGEANQEFQVGAFKAAPVNQVPPKILAASSCTTIPSRVRCTCLTVGSPPPSVHWFIGGERVHTNDQLRVEVLAVNSSVVLSVLTVLPPFDGLPVVLCHSVNSAGKTDREFSAGRLQPLQRHPDFGLLGSVVVWIMVGALISVTVFLCVSLVMFLRRRIWR